MQHYWLSRTQEYRRKAKEYWLQLAPREKKAVSIGSAALGIFILYATIWSPILNHNDELRQGIRTNAATLAWMQNADKEIQKAKTESQTQTTMTSPAMMLSFLQKEITVAGLSSSLMQLKQSSNETINLQFKKVEFDKLMKLLIDITQKQKITITQMSSVSGVSPGIVDVDIAVTLHSLGGHM